MLATCLAEDKVFRRTMICPVHQVWRQWIAALCAVIALCLYPESAQADAPAQNAYSIESALISDDLAHFNMHEAPAGESGGEAPNRDAPQTHCHHCGAAHAAYIIDSVGVYAAGLAILTVDFASEQPAPLSRLSSSLKRPPRPSAEA